MRIKRILLCFAMALLSAIAIGISSLLPFGFALPLDMLFGITEIVSVTGAIVFAFTEID